MSVHEAISAHSRKQHAHLEAFLAMEAERENAIEEAVTRCRAGEPFTVERINAITDRINEHALNGISPTRVRVTAQMVEDYAGKLK